MVKKADVPRHIIKTALALAESQGWRDTRLGDIADTAKLPLGDLLAIYPSKTAIIAAYSRQIDCDVTKAIDPELAGEPPRDRLFGIIRVKGLAAIYLSVLRVWLNDDSEDMAQTMSALDRALRRAEFLLGLCRLPARWKRNGEAEPEADVA